MAPNYAQSNQSYKGTGKKLNEEENRPVKWHWSLTLTIAGGLIGGGLTVWMLQYTVISFVYVAAGVLGIAAIAFFAQWKYFYGYEFIKKHFRIHLGIYVLYNVAGIGLTISGLFFLLNYAGAGSEEQIERHRILGLDRDFVVDSNFLTVLQLENDAYENDPWMRAMPYQEAVMCKSNPFLDIITVKGLFGVPIFQGLRMSPDPDAIKQKIESLMEPADDEIKTDSIVQNDTISALSDSAAGMQ